MLTKAIRFSVFALIFVIGAFIFIVNFSSTETSYRCVGKFTYNGDALEQREIFIKHERYRWWVDLWSESNSDGNLWFEIPGKSVHYFSHLHEMENMIQISIEQGKFKGQFSKLSNTLSLKTYIGVFDGVCSPVNQ